MTDEMGEVKREMSSRDGPGMGRGGDVVQHSSLGPSFNDVLVHHITRSKFRLRFVVFHAETFLDLDRAGADGRLAV